VARRSSFDLGAAVRLEDLERDPHPTLARLREREPVSWIPALDGWLITAYEPAIRVMRDPETFTVDDPGFSTAQVVGPSMLSLDGAEHVRHRAPFAAPFRPAAVRRRFAEEVECEADRLIDGFAADGSAELRRAFAGPLAAAGVTRLLGLERSEVPSVLDWYDAIVAAVTSITAGGSVPVSGTRAFQALRARLEPVIDAGEPSSLLAAAAVGSSLSPAEIVSNAAVLLFGGIETTEGMISNAILHLLGHRTESAAERTTAEPLEAVIEESLRLEPAAAVVDRYAAGDVELAGAEIKRGELVRVSIAAANRDPGVFPDPDRFDPHRFDRDLSRPDSNRRPTHRRHIAFAHGPHVCLGVHLARLEARIALARLLARLPRLRLDPDRPSQISGLVFRKPPALHVVWS
jgi:cytochrome P450